MGPARTTRGRHRHARRHGFTLLEAMMASVILVIAVAAFCQAVATGQAVTAEAIHGVRASLLADALLEEVLAQPYHDPQPPDNESARDAFDDLDDYHGFTQAAGAVSDATGAAYPPPYQLFSRSVSVTAMSADAPGGAAAGKRVTVTVSAADGQRWVVTHFVPEPIDG